MQDAVNHLRGTLPLEEAEALRKLGISVHDDIDDSGTAPDTGQVERAVPPHEASPFQSGSEW